MSDQNLLSVRVFIERTGNTKTLRFDAGLTVDEILKEIRVKTDQGGPDHGLFLPPNKETGKKGVWLDKLKPFKYYGIKSDTLLEYKSVYRPLRIRLVDDTTKVILIDDSLNVRQLSDFLGEKLGLGKATSEEFCLRKPTPPGMAKAPLWLVEAQTLNEQDISPDEELEFAKRIFFSDDYIDKDDAFTLHLLYVEATKAIIEGRYPISRDQGVTFAALQMQITFGDHNPDKHKPGFFDKEKFLPLLYRKDKKVELDILKAHKTQVGMKIDAAKLRYVQNVRGLKTYGITFFNCQLVPKGKKKAIPTLVGLTREKIVRVNPDTQEIIKEWKWSQMRRWASVKNTFTLDFGEYDDDYLTLITEEAEALSQLVAGYIDMILKSRVDPTNKVEDSDEDTAKVDTLTADFGLANAGSVLSWTSPYGQGANQGFGFPGQFYSYPYVGPGGSNYSFAGLPPSQRVNVVDLGSAARATRLLGNELGTQKAIWGNPKDKSEADWNKDFLMHRANIAKGMNDLLGAVKIEGGKLNRKDLDTRAKELTMELMNLATCARNMAALNEDRAPLLDGAKAVSDAVADLMRLLSSADLPENAATLEAAIAAAKKMFLTADMLLDDPKLINYVDSGSELLLLECVNVVDSNIEHMLSATTTAAEDLPPSKKTPLLQEVAKVQAVKGFALGSLRSLASQSLDPRVQKQVEAVNTTLTAMVNDLHGKTKVAGLPAVYGPVLADAVDRINLALKNLVEGSRTAESRLRDLRAPLQNIMHELVHLKSVMDYPFKIYESSKKVEAAQHEFAKVVALVTQDLKDEKAKERLNLLSKELEKSLKNLMDTIEVQQRNKDDPELRGKVVAIADKMELQCAELLNDPLVITALNELRYQSKLTAAAVMKLITSANTVSSDVNDKTSKTELLGAAKTVTSALTELLSTLHLASGNPESLGKQADLLEAARKNIPAYAELTLQSKKAARYVNDPNSRQTLDLDSSDTAEKVVDLQRAVKDAADALGTGAVDNAIAEFDWVRADLTLTDQAAAQGKLTVPPEQTRDHAAALLELAASSLNKALEEMVTAGKKSGDLPPHIHQAAVALTQASSAIRPLAASTSDKAAQRKLIAQARAVLDSTVQLSESTRSLAMDTQDKDKAKLVERQLKSTAEAIKALTAEAEALDSKDLSQATSDIEAAKKALARNYNPNADFRAATDALLSASKALTVGSNQITSVVRTHPELLGPSARVLGTSGTQALRLINTVASAINDDKSAESLLAAGRALSDALLALLNACNTAAQKPTAENIAAAERAGAAVNKAIDAVFNSFTAASPETQQALQQLSQGIAQYDSGKVEGAFPGSRDDIVTEMLSQAKELQRATMSLGSAASVSGPKVGVYALESAAKATNLLTAARAAVLSEQLESNQASLDGARIARGAEFIQANPKDGPRVHRTAKQITQASSNLIATAKARAKAEPDAAKRSAMLGKALELARATTELGQAAKDTTSGATGAVPTKAYAELTRSAQQVAAKARTLEDSMRQPGERSDELVPGDVSKRLGKSVRAIAGQVADVVRTAANASANPDNETAAKELKKYNLVLAESLRSLLQECSALNPAVQECQSALTVLQKASAELEAANAAAASGGAIKVDAPASGIGLVGAQQQCSSVAKQLADDLKAILAAGDSGNSRELVAALQKIATDAPLLGNWSRGVASQTLGDANAQTQLLTLAKAVMDSLGELVKQQLSGSSDPQSRAKVAASAETVTGALGLLLSQLQSGAQLQNDLQETLLALERALQTLAKPLEKTSRPYLECRQGLSTSARDVALAATSLFSVDKRNVGQVGLLAARIGTAYPRVVENTRDSAYATHEETARSELIDAATAVGKSAVGMVSFAKSQTEGKAVEQIQLLNHYNALSAAVGRLLAAAKKGAVGDQQIDEAVLSIKQAISRLNHSALFARAGQLPPSKEAASMTMSNLQTKLTRTAAKIEKKATEVSNAAGKSSESTLGSTAAQLAHYVSRVDELTTMTASRMGDSGSQQEVLAAAKMLSMVTQQFLTASREAQNNPQDPTAVALLPALQNSISEYIGRLVHTVAATSAEASRAERELQAAKQRILDLLEKGYTARGGIPEAVKAARAILSNASDLVFAENQDEIIAAGRASADTTEALLTSVKAASMALTEDEELRAQVEEACNAAAKAVTKLLEVAKLSRENEDTLPKLEGSSEKITTSLQDLFAVMQRLPNVGELKLEDDKVDLNALAEQELTKCSQVVAESGQLISSSRPKRTTPKVAGVVNQEDITEAILDASAAITSATRVMVSAATAAQQERTNVAKAQTSTHSTRKITVDPTWANGLINAAQGVSNSTKALTSASRETAVGKFSEDAMVNAARSVANSTAHLAAASRSKADPNSQSQQSLATAARSVSEAVSQLVNATHAAAQYGADDAPAGAGGSGDGGAEGAAMRIRELEQQMKILKLEKDLARERRRLQAMQKAKAAQT